MIRETGTITYDDLNRKVSLTFKKDEIIKKIDKAFLFAKKKHQGQMRNTGEEFIFHPINVAYILANLNVDAITIMAALLHETLITTDTTKEELEECFGKEVANLCVNVSKICNLDLQEESEIAAIYLRKVLVGLAEDVRVIFIRLADRLHNMRTLWAIKPEKRKETCYDTLNVLIPIAHRLGINSIKSELEDLCLRYTKPDVYQDILDYLDKDREAMSNILTEMKESISNILTDHGIKFHIKGRVKSVHSIYKKLVTGRKFSDIYDILALRIFVEEESDCYLAISLIHSKYRPLPKRFKDYIAMPKENMYQSLHTTVFGIDGQLFEIQLRTYEMDEIAEKGLASHWSYKEKGTKKTQNIMEQKLEMFRNLIESNSENKSDDEFVSQISDEFLSEVIYIYTPKGDVVELPKESTPIDFAYRIHSAIGDTTTGAIVNNKIVTLDTPLNDGDIIEIKTNPNSTPNKEWIKFVKTSQAKSKIKAFFSKKDKSEYIKKGEELLEKELRRRKITSSEFNNEQNIKKILKDLKLSTEEDLYLAVGSLRYTPTYIIELTNADKKDVQDILIDKSLHKGIDNNYKNDIIVAGSTDIKVNIANCCKPIQGDEIIGYITKGQGIMVHKRECQNIQNTIRLIDVEWNGNSDKYYLTNLTLEVNSDKNYLLDIMTIASQKNIYVEDFKIRAKDVYSVYELTIKIKNSIDLEKLINLLENQKYIINIRR